MKKLVTLFTLLAVSFVSAQLKDGELFDTLEALDQKIFEASFETCDIEFLASVVAEDIEFYHDRGGLNKGKESFLETTKKNLCNSPTDLRRELVAGSLEVYPLYKNGVLYGAIQKGEHHFFEGVNEKERKTSIAKFTHLWLKEQDQWHIKRVLSYDHQSPK